MAVDPIRNDGGPHVRAAAVQTHALFERHSRMVYGLCRALLRDPDDADDATQSTFIAAYQSLLAGNRVREPAAWLATIARNECAARSRNRMREPLPLADADIAQAQGLDVDLERIAVVAELRRAIAGLPQKQREAVVLRDLYGLPYTEVGAALGISLASVESLLFRARRSLRISLKSLAGGALTVPLAVREAVAQALPALGAGGGRASGAVGIGLIAKLAGGPATLKATSGLAAAVAAGSIAVAGVEHGGTVRSQHPATSAAARATSPASTQPARVSAAPADPGGRGSSARRGSGPQGEDSSRSSGGHSGRGSTESEETRAVSDQKRGGEGSEDEGVVAAPLVKHDGGEGASGVRSSSPLAGRTGQDSNDGHGGDAGSHSGQGSGGDGGSHEGSDGISRSEETSGPSGDDSRTLVESANSGSSGGGPGGEDAGGDDLGGSHDDSGGGDDSHGGHGGDTPPSPA